MKQRGISTLYILYISKTRHLENFSNNKNWRHLYCEITNYSKIDSVNFLLSPFIFFLLKNVWYMYSNIDTQFTTTQMDVYDVLYIHFFLCLLKSTAYVHVSHKKKTLSCSFFLRTKSKLKKKKRPF